MIIPIRCMTCGKPIGHLWESYQKEVKARKNPKAVLDSLGLERYCCRSAFLTHRDLIPTIGKFKR
jgi:DNA-directed RNA polymerase subunit N